MNHSDVVTLFDHLYFIRDHVLDAADDAAVPFGDEPAPTIRNLRATLVHELDVEWSWRVRLRQDDRRDFSSADEDLRPEDFATLRALRERWAADEVEMRAWLDSLSDDDLAGPCRTERSGSHPFWFHLQHLYSHGIQQLSDAAVLLTAAGRSPGELDFLEFVDARDRSAGDAT
jgi:uncharacterized damage-inducible protein DinB